MSEHEPIEEQQADIEKAAKLREMVQTAGWREVFEPHIRREIEGYKRDILGGPFNDLGELRLSQEKLRYLEYLVAYPSQEIAKADRIINEGAAKQERAEKHEPI